MAESETYGALFRAIIDRSGVSYRDLAKLAGFRHASGIQRYTNVENDRPFGVDVVKKFAAALAGKGTPPVTEREIFALAGLDNLLLSNASAPIPYEGSSGSRMAKDLPIYGSALGAEVIMEGHSIEQTYLNTSETIEYRERPPILNGKTDVYGLYVQGSSMEPAFDDGDLIIVQHSAAISAGDFVVVYLRPNDDSDDGERARAVLIKRLVRRTAQYYELLQYQPEATFRIPAKDVLRLDRVLRMRDLLK